MKIGLPILKNDVLLNLLSKLVENNIKTEFYKTPKVIVIVTIETVISKNIMMGNLFSKMNFLWINIIQILFEVQIKHCSGDFNPWDIHHHYSLFTINSYLVPNIKIEINCKISTII